MPREFQIESPRDYRDFLVGKLVMLADDLNKNKEIESFLSSSQNLKPEKMEQKIYELQEQGSTKKLSSILDKIADSLQQKGHLGEAEEIDVVTNTLENQKNSY